MMKLLIDGISHTFMPIRAFRTAHNLPPEFGVALFEPKDYTGLGSINRAGAEERRARDSAGCSSCAACAAFTAADGFGADGVISRAVVCHQSCSRVARGGD
jgi:hypothetical protein